MHGHVSIPPVCAHATPPSAILTPCAGSADAFGREWESQARKREPGARPPLSAPPPLWLPLQLALPVWGRRHPVDKGALATASASVRTHYGAWTAALQRNVPQGLQSARHAEPHPRQREIGPEETAPRRHAHMARRHAGRPHLLDEALAQDLEGSKCGIRLPSHGVAVPRRLAGHDAFLVENLAAHC